MRMHASAQSYVGLFVLIGTVAALAQAQCPLHYELLNDGNCYHFDVNTRRDFQSSLAYCAGLGGTLPILKDPTSYYHFRQRALVIAELNTEATSWARSFWMGVSNVGSDDKAEDWTWMDGTPALIRKTGKEYYPVWQANQPGNSGGCEAYATMMADTGEWADWKAKSTGQHNAFVACQRKPDADSYLRYFRLSNNINQKVVESHKSFTPTYDDDASFLPFGDVMQNDYTPAVMVNMMAPWYVWTYPFDFTSTGTENVGALNNFGMQTCAKEAWWCVHTATNTERWCEGVPGNWCEDAAGNTGFNPCPGYYAGPHMAWPAGACPDVRLEYSVWEPDCPEGFVGLGQVISAYKPSVYEYACVAEKFTTKALGWVTRNSEMKSPAMGPSESGKDPLDFFLNPYFEHDPSGGFASRKVFSIQQLYHSEFDLSHVGYPQHTPTVYLPLSGKEDEGFSGTKFYGSDGQLMGTAQPVLAGSNKWENKETNPMLATGDPAQMMLGLSKTFGTNSNGLTVDTQTQLDADTFTIAFWMKRPTTAVSKNHNLVTYAGISLNLLRGRNLGVVVDDVPHIMTGYSKRWDETAYTQIILTNGVSSDDPVRVYQDGQLVAVGGSLSRSAPSGNTAFTLGVGDDSFDASWFNEIDVGVTGQKITDQLTHNPALYAHVQFFDGTYCDDEMAASLYYDMYPYFMMLTDVSPSVMDTPPTIDLDMTTGTYIGDFYSGWDVNPSGCTQPYQYADGLMFTAGTGMVIPLSGKGFATGKYSSYTIQMEINVPSQSSGYHRLIQLDGYSDTGFYLLNGQVKNYPYESSSWMIGDNGRAILSFSVDIPSQQAAYKINDDEWVFTQFEVDAHMIDSVNPRIMLFHDLDASTGCMHGGENADTAVFFVKVWPGFFDGSSSIPVCGDYFVEASEECDGTDGCNFNCMCAHEQGYFSDGAGGCVNPCQPNPCWYEGECTVTDVIDSPADAFTCNCRHGIDGDHCQFKLCGDGEVQTFHPSSSMPGVKYHEMCDDGNDVAGDGCSPSCHIEAGYECKNGAGGSKCAKKLKGGVPSDALVFSWSGSAMYSNKGFARIGKWPLDNLEPSTFELDAFTLSATVTYGVGAPSQWVSVFGFHQVAPGDCDGLSFGTINGVWRFGKKCSRTEMIEFDASIVDGETQKVAITYDGAFATLTINGMVRDRKALKLTGLTRSGKVLVGAGFRDGGEQWSGTIENVSVSAGNTPCRDTSAFQYKQGDDSVAVPSVFSNAMDVRGDGFTISVELDLASEPSSSETVLFSTSNSRACNAFELVLSSENKLGVRLSCGATEWTDVALLGGWNDCVVSYDGVRTVRVYGPSSQVPAEVSLDLSPSAALGATTLAADSTVLKLTAFLGRMGPCAESCAVASKWSADQQRLRHGNTMLARPTAIVDKFSHTFSVKLAYRNLPANAFGPLLIAGEETDGVTVNCDIFQISVVGGKLAYGNVCGSPIVTDVQLPTGNQPTVLAVVSNEAGHKFYVDGQVVNVDARQLGPYPDRGSWFFGYAPFTRGETTGATIIAGDLFASVLHECELCGDGIIGPTEECDNARTDDPSADGCSNQCLVLDDFTCVDSATGSVCYGFTDIFDFSRASIVPKFTNKDARIARAFSTPAHRLKVTTKDGTTREFSLDANGNKVVGEFIRESADLTFITDASNCECGFCPHGLLALGASSSPQSCDVANLAGNVVVRLAIEHKAAICGDGQLQFGEHCDDGNADGGDGCSAECDIELGFECIYPERTIGLPVCQMKQLEAGGEPSKGTVKAGQPVVMKLDVSSAANKKMKFTEGFGMVVYARQGSEPTLSADRRRATEFDKMYTPTSFPFEIDLGAFPTGEWYLSMLSHNEVDLSAGIAIEEELPPAPTDIVIADPTAPETTSTDEAADDVVESLSTGSWQYSGVSVTSDQVSEGNALVLDVTGSVSVYVSRGTDSVPNDVDYDFGYGASSQMTKYQVYIPNSALYADTYLIGIEGAASSKCDACEYDIQVDLVKPEQIAIGNDAVDLSAEVYAGSFQVWETELAEQTTVSLYTTAGTANVLHKAGAGCVTPTAYTNKWSCANADEYCAESITLAAGKHSFALQSLGSDSNARISILIEEPVCNEPVANDLTNTVTYAGRVYAVLDDTAPGTVVKGCQNKAIRVPDGWSVAPNTAETHIAASQGFWGTTCLVMRDGTSVDHYTTVCGTGQLVTYDIVGEPDVQCVGVASCNARVLLVKDTVSTSLADGSFESGFGSWQVVDQVGSSDWSIKSSSTGGRRRSSSTYTYDGTSSVTVTNLDTSAGGALYQDVTIGQTSPLSFEVSAWSEATGVTGSPDEHYALYIDITFQDGTTELGSNWAAWSTGTHAWEEQRVVIRPTKAVASIKIWLTFSNHAGTASFDHVSVEPPTGNLVSNSGFQQIDDAVTTLAEGWSQFGSEGYSQTSAQSYAGGLSITGIGLTTNANGGAQQTIELTSDVLSEIGLSGPQTDGYTLYISGWSRALTVGGVSDAGYAIYVDMECKDGSWIYARYAPFAVGTHDWEQAMATYDVTECTELERVHVMAMFRGHTGQVWFDDITVMLAPGRETTLSGYSYGDPHITTWSNRAYDNQAVGEYILAQEPGKFEVQARQGPAGFGAINVGAAVRYTHANGQSSLVQITASEGTEFPAFHVNGVAVDAIYCSGVVELQEGATATVSGQLSVSSTLKYTITFPGSEGDELVEGAPTYAMVVEVRLSAYDVQFMSIRADMPASGARNAAGLFGVGTRSAADDFTTKDGSVIPDSVDERGLYDQFIQTWRLDDTSSYLHYPNGTTSSTFTSNDYHTALYDAAFSPEATAAAEAACGSLTVSESLRSACFLDVLYTGDHSFAWSTMDAAALLKGGSGINELVAEENSQVISAQPSSGRRKAALPTSTSEVADDEYGVLSIALAGALMVGAIFVVVIRSRQQALRAEAEEQAERENDEAMPSARRTPKLTMARVRSSPTVARPNRA